MGQVKQHSPALLPPAREVSETLPLLVKEELAFTSKQACKNAVQDPFHTQVKN